MRQRSSSPSSRGIRIGALFAVLLLALAACGGGETDPAAQAGDTEADSTDTAGTSDATEEAEESAERVALTVATASPAAALWAPMWLASALGFYEDENLDVEVIGQLTGGTVEQALMTGSLDFGGITQDTLIPRAAETDDVPILFIHETLWVDMLLTLESSGFETGEDLVGKVIGIPEAKDEAVAALLMSAAGVEPDSYDTLVVGARAPAAVAMERGETDAFAGTFVDLYAMETAGFDVRVMDTGDTASLYNSGVGVNPQIIEDDPELVIRFGQAFARAMVWMYEADTDVVLDLLSEVVPEAVEDRESAAVLLNASKERNRPIFEARGEGDGEVWQDTVDLYVELGQLDESYDANRLYTNELIDAIWDFDVDAETEAARAGDR